MRFLKLIFTASLLFGIQNFSWTQIAINEIQIWFEDSKESNAISITTNFLSTAEDLVVLNYEISIAAQENGTLKKIDFEKGEFLAAQNLPIPLSIKTIEIADKRKIVLMLEVFQGNQSIVQEEFKWENKGLNFNKAEIAAVEVQKQKDQKENLAKTNINAIEIQPQKKTQKRINNNKIDALEIQGLIIDETRSKIGRDFYEIFFRKWIPPRETNGDFIITIKELPSFGRSSRVSLEVNNQPLGIRNLNPRLEYVEQQVNASIRQIRSYLSQRSKISKDLENEDTSGSGIY